MASTRAPGLGPALLIATLAGIGLADRPASANTPPPPPPPVNVRGQLMITDLSVVEDPQRTNPRDGRAPWTFRHLMEELAGPRNPSDFVMDWLRQWETDQVIAGHVVEARPAIRERVIDPWLAASGGGRLDLSKAPFKLLAIVNRIDLREHDGPAVQQAGEGRFIFGVLGPDGRPLPPTAGPAPGGFLVIFEFRLVASDMSQLHAWADRWAGLGRYPVGSDTYRAELEKVTRAFSDVRRLGPQLARLNQLRTNEIALAPEWQLREFVVDQSTGWLRSETVANTPDTVEMNGTPELADLINANTPELLSDSFSLPIPLEGASSVSGPFTADDFPDFADRTFTVRPLGGPFFDAPWSAAGIVNNDARAAFGLGTCNGCHRDETATGFVQVGFPVDNQLPRSLGRPATLSGFLRGIDVVDPVDGVTVRHFADLDRRKADLEDLLASFAGGPGPTDRSRHPRRPH